MQHSYTSLVALGLASESSSIGPLLGIPPGRGSGKGANERAGVQSAVRARQCDGGGDASVLRGRVRLRRDEGSALSVEGSSDNTRKVRGPTVDSLCRS